MNILINCYINILINSRTIQTKCYNVQFNSNVRYIGRHIGNSQYISVQRQTILFNIQLVAEFYNSFTFVFICIDDTGFFSLSINSCQINSRSISYSSGLYSNVIFHFVCRNLICKSSLDNCTLFVFYNQRCFFILSSCIFFIFFIVCRFYVQCPQAIFCFSGSRHTTIVYFPVVCNTFNRVRQCNIKNFSFSQLQREIKLISQFHISGIYQYRQFATLFYYSICSNTGKVSEFLSQCLICLLCFFCSILYSRLPLCSLEFNLNYSSRSFHYKCIRSSRQSHLLELAGFVSDMQYINAILLYNIGTSTLCRDFSSLFYEFTFNGIPFVNYPHSIGVDFGRRSSSSRLTIFSIFCYSLRSGLFTVLVPETVFTDSPFSTVFSICPLDTCNGGSSTVAHGYSETVFNRRDVGYPFSFSYQFLQSCNSILVRVDLALQILDVIIIVFTRHKCSC